MDDEYAKLIRRLNPPRVVIDNDASEDATVIQVDSVNKHGILLKVVQVLTDMNLVITKAYISSDGDWFMDVFNVVDQDGKKIRDKEVMDYIQRRLESNASFAPSLRGSVGVMPSEEHTAIELTGTDRPGLLSEVCAVLTDLHCNVVNAEIWTHNTRAAAVVHVTDDSTGCAIKDPKRLSTIRELLCNVLKGNDDSKTATMTLSPPGVTSRERRLHQIMFADRDYERVERAGLARFEDKSSRPHVTVLNIERDYTVVSMRSKDRPKLLFDIVCTLTDMEYVVFHGMVSTGRMEAYQEFYIRHVDGLPVSSDAERERVVQCLEAAIERRASEGLELELCTEDRVGLLSDITRIFRENSLCIKRAEILTKGGKAKDTFYVTDVTGNPVDPKIIDSICRQIGQTKLQVKPNSILSVSLSLSSSLCKTKNPALQLHDFSPLNLGKDSSIMQPLITPSPSSPSFNSYSSNKLAEIAARVVQEFTNESEQVEDANNNIFSWQEQGGEEKSNHPQNDNEEEEDDFEFAVLSRQEPQFPPISADDIFYNGQIRPFYPLFNTKLLLDDQESLPRSKTATNSTQDAKKPNRLPLRKLFYEDRETFSCSSSEADDMDSLEPGTYCVWTPKKEEGSPGSCKKSSSTGSNSKRWKFKDFIHRSNSDGKDTFVFLMPNNKKSGLHHQRLGSDDQDGNHNKQGTEKRKEAKGAGGGLFQFQEHYYVRSKEGDKRRSYLPYRPDLVGFLSNVNGVGRNLHPF